MEGQLIRTARSLMQRHRADRMLRLLWLLLLCLLTSTGPPACLMLLMGEAPVPPSWPLIWITSALALATPDATTPMPASATSLTDTCVDLKI